MVALTFLVLLVVPTWATSAQRPDCRAKPSHTLCRRPHPACLHKKKGVDAAARAQILKLHNDYRSQVARGQLPGFRPAADMQELLWDDELEEVAQAHTELCTDTRGLAHLEHDRHDDRTTAKFPVVGQNLANKYGTGSFPEDWTIAVKGWFDEYKDYPPDRIAAFNPPRGGPLTGHFTQVIWAQSRYVGCGFLHYYVRGSPYTDIMLYTCDYATAGNVRRRPVYQEGATCSACPVSTVCNRTTGLCDGAGPRPPPPPPRPPPPPPPPRTRPPPPPPPTPRPRPPPPPRTRPPRPPRPPPPPPPPRRTRRPPPPPRPRPRPRPTTPETFPDTTPYPGTSPTQPGSVLPPAGSGGQSGGGGGGGSPDPQMEDDSDSFSWVSFVAGVVAGLSVGAVLIACFYCRYSVSGDRHEAQPEPGPTTPSGFQSSNTALG